MKPRLNTFLAFVVICVCCTGCAEISTEYGKTKGMSGRTSLNGFGAFRSAYENAGFRDRDVTRLSDRVMRTDVIVWTPQILGPIDAPVTRWFDRWLRRGGRTLVYIVPDSGSEADYWIDAAKLAPPAQRLEYRKRAAGAINERMLWRLNRGDVRSNGWFRIETLKHRRKLGTISGPWSEDFGDLSKQDHGTESEFVIVAYEKTKNVTPNPNPGFVTTGPTGPGPATFVLTSDTTPTSTPTDFRDLVRTHSGDTVIAQIESKNWKDSRIIVVAGGSLLTNYALTRPLNQQLAERIIQESIPAGVDQPSAGFLTSSWSQIPVSERKPGVPKASGMELLTVWPISLVTMHGVMLGLVICLMLLPIFGRPRKIQREKSSDFGHHLDAVAALMNKSGGEPYARARISEYMKRMHGETSGPWILPDVAGHGLKTSLPSRTSPRKESNVTTTDNASPEDQPQTQREQESQHEPKEESDSQSDVASKTNTLPATIKPETDSPKHFPTDEAER